jgi:hypothetical protein
MFLSFPLSLHHSLFQHITAKNFLDSNTKQFNRAGISLTPENNDVIMFILIHCSSSLMKEKK